MTIPIQGTAPILAPELAPSLGAAQASQPGAFREMFARSLQEVQAYQNEATKSTERFLSGEAEDLHTVAMATQKAELSFEMFLQVRNKVVQAYQEVMRMQV
jgi:flagellar hook-basal body complex protein FliE